jgi:DNA-binding NarL/FixJ family response regulator
MIDLLLVEDNAEFRQVIGEILSSHFSTVHIAEAADGEQAFQQIQTQHPCIIIMDIQLPGENGLELTKKIRTLYPEIAIIILTQYDLPAYREAALRYGARCFLSKGSSTPNDIIASVESLLSHMGLNSHNSNGEETS